MALKLLALSLIILGACWPSYASAARCGSVVALSQRVGRFQKVTTATSPSGHTLTLALDDQGRVFRIWDTRKQHGLSRQYRTFISPFEISLPTREKLRSLTTVEAPSFLMGNISMIVGLVTTKKAFLLMPSGQLVALPTAVPKDESLTDIALSLEGEMLSVYVSSNRRVFSAYFRLYGKYTSGIDLKQPPRLRPYNRSLPGSSKVIALSSDHIVTVQNNSPELASVMRWTNQGQQEIGRFTSIAGITGHRRHSTDNVYVVGRLTSEQTKNRLYLWTNRSHTFTPVTLPWDNFSNGQITAFTSHASRETNYRYQNETTLLQKAYTLRRPGRTFAMREIGVVDCLDATEHCPIFFGQSADGWVMSDLEMVAEGGDDREVQESILLALDDLAAINLGGDTAIMSLILERSNNIVKSRYDNLLRFWGECRLISEVIRNDDTGVSNLLAKHLPNPRLQVLFLSLIDADAEPNILIDSWSQTAPSTRQSFISRHMRNYGVSVMKFLSSPKNAILDRLTLVLGYNSPMDCHLALLHYFAQNREGMKLPLLEGLLAFMEHSGQNPLWHDALKNVEGNEYGE